MSITFVKRSKIYRDFFKGNLRRCWQVFVKKTCIDKIFILREEYNASDETPKNFEKLELSKIVNGKYYKREMRGREMEKNLYRACDDKCS